MVDVNFSDVQGLLLSSYTKNMPCANYVLLKVTGSIQGRKWLDSISEQITTGAQRKADYCMNIAFTATGLQEIGKTAEELISFPIAFQEGMTTAARQKILGDEGVNDPLDWTWGGPQHPVQVLLLVYAKDEEELKYRLSAIDAGITEFGGVEIIDKLSAGRQPDNHEHFGFLDGVGQPVIEGSDQETRQKDRTGHATVVKAGEFILGYENEMHTIDPLPKLKVMPDFGLNGSYLVFRQIKQDVHTFWNYLKDTTTINNGESDLKEQERLGAKIIGRWKSGAAITTYPDEDPAGPNEVNEDNTFTFASNDPAGFGCPVGAHIRRTNPRDSLFDDPQAAMITVKRHRLMRRGRSYGDRSKDVYSDDGKDRGLHFICLVGNLERQFEFVQQSWVNNKTFSGLYNETDPLMGQRDVQKQFTIQGPPVRKRIHDLPDFVSIKGGAYFFMPCIAALKQLCKL
jgi:Dyp-type peroxidase family